jgi:membrane fusion protein (multidrug efflux system)
MRMQRVRQYSSWGSRAASRIFITCVAVAVACAVGGCEKQAAVAPPPPVVEVVTTATRDVPIYKEWVGALDGNVNAVIKPQVTGYLIKQNYVEGQMVKKGHVLFEIDPRTFQAAVDQAKGSLDQAKGDLARAEAAYMTAKAELARIKPLAAKNAVSQRDLDDATGRDLGTKASVEAAKASVAAAAANLEKARLDLGFTRITSPVDGIAGIAKTQLGNLVSPNSQQELTTVSSVNPIKSYINVSEREYLAVRESTKNPENIPLQITLADGSVYPHKGKLALSDRQIDPTTGTLKIGTLFPNPDNILRPGGYSLVRATMGIRKGAILIPQRAVSDVQGKLMVAVVGSDNKVDIRQVKVGERIGSDWIITEGLKPGETVVVEGTQKARPGAIVNPKPFSPNAPAAAPETKPAAPAADKKKG